MMLEYLQRFCMVLDLTPDALLKLLQQLLLGLQLLLQLLAL